MTNLQLTLLVILALANAFLLWDRWKSERNNVQKAAVERAQLLKTMLELLDHSAKEIKKYHKERISSINSVWDRIGTEADPELRAQELKAEQESYMKTTQETRELRERYREELAGTQQLRWSLVLPRWSLS